MTGSSLGCIPPPESPSGLLPQSQRHRKWVAPVLVAPLGMPDLRMGDAERLKMNAKRERQSWTPEPWRPMRDYRMACTECDWRQIEQFKRNANRVARGHADESGHKVEMQRQQYKTIRPRPTAT